MPILKNLRATVRVQALVLLSVVSCAALAQGYTDSDITAAVESEYLFDAVVPFNEVDISTAEGIVTLSGEVQHIGAKRHAERIAESVKGVRSVVNQITVTPTILPASALRRAVEDALRVDPATDEYEINVTADSMGKVTV